MFQLDRYLEKIWDNLLSKDDERVQQAYTSLDNASQQEVEAHLKRMATDSGWHPQQVQSARIALDAIHRIGKE